MSTENGRHYYVEINQKSGKSTLDQVNEAIKVNEDQGAVYVRMDTYPRSDGLPPYMFLLFVKPA